MRGWRREVISLLFILLGIFFVRPGTSQGIAAFIQQLPTRLSYLVTGSAASPTNGSNNYNLGPLGTILIFMLVVALGYYVGNRAFPKPATPLDRFIGVVPALISAAAVLYFLNISGIFVKDAQGQESIAAVFQIPDPSSYVPLLFIIAIIAVIVGLVSTRVNKKSSPPAKK